MGADSADPRSGLHHRVGATVTRHGLDSAASLADVLTAVARHRGRPVELEPLPPEVDTGQVFGLCLPYPDRDVILFRTGAGAKHELHSTLHECGHLLLDHVAPAEQPAGSNRLAQLLPALDPELIAGALRRSSYEDAQEMEAETFAMVLRATIDTQQRRRGDAVLTRFDDALG